MQGLHTATYTYADTNAASSDPYADSDTTLSNAYANSTSSNAYSDSAPSNADTNCASTEADSYA
jgi:hypothetical protein